MLFYHLVAGKNFSRYLELFVFYDFSYELKFLARLSQLSIQQKEEIPKILMIELFGER